MSFLCLGKTPELYISMPFVIFLHVDVLVQVGIGTCPVTCQNDIKESPLSLRNDTANDS